MQTFLNAYLSNVKENIIFWGNKLTQYTISHHPLSQIPKEQIDNNRSKMARAALAIPSAATRTVVTTLDGFTEQFLTSEKAQSFLSKQIAQLSNFTVDGVRIMSEVEALSFQQNLMKAADLARFVVTEVLTRISEGCVKTKSSLLPTLGQMITENLTSNQFLTHSFQELKRDHREIERLLDLYSLGDARRRKAIVDIVQDVHSDLLVVNVTQQSFNPKAHWPIVTKALQDFFAKELTLLNQVKNSEKDETRRKNLEEQYLTAQGFYNEKNAIELLKLVYYTKIHHLGLVPQLLKEVIKSFIPTNILKFLPTSDGPFTSFFFEVILPACSIFPYKIGSFVYSYLEAKAVIPELAMNTLSALKNKEYREGFDWTQKGIEALVNQEGLKAELKNPELAKACEGVAQRIVPTLTKLVGEDGFKLFGRIVGFSAVLGANCITNPKFCPGTVKTELEDLLNPHALREAQQTVENIRPEIEGVITEGLTQLSPAHANQEIQAIHTWIQEALTGALLQACLLLPDIIKKTEKPSNKNDIDQLIAERKQRYKATEENLKDEENGLIALLQDESELRKAQELGRLEMDQLTNRQARLTREIETAGHDLETVKSNAARLDKELEECRKKRDLLKDGLKQIGEEGEVFYGREVLQRRIDQLTPQLELLRNEMRALQDEIVDLQLENTPLEKHQNKLHARLKEIQDNFVSLNERKEVLQPQFEKKKGLIDTVINVAKRSKHGASTIKTAQQELHNLSVELEAISNQLRNEKQEEAEILDYLERHPRVKEIAAILGEKIVAFRNKKNEIEEVQNELNELPRLLKLQNEKISEFATTQDALMVAEKQVLDGLVELDGLVRKIGEKKSTLDSLVSDLRILTERLEEINSFGERSNKIQKAISEMKPRIIEARKAYENEKARYDSDYKEDVEKWLEEFRALALHHKQQYETLKAENADNATIAAAKAKFVEARRRYIDTKKSYKKGEIKALPKNIHVDALPALSDFLKHFLSVEADRTLGMKEALGSILSKMAQLFFDAEITPAGQELVDDEKDRLEDKLLNLVDKDVVNLATREIIGTLAPFLLETGRELPIKLSELAYEALNDFDLYRNEAEFKPEQISKLPSMLEGLTDDGKKAAINLLSLRGQYNQNIKDGADDLYGPNLSPAQKDRLVLNGGVATKAMIAELPAHILNTIIDKTTNDPEFHEMFSAIISQVSDKLFKALRIVAKDAWDKLAPNDHRAKKALIGALYAIAVSLDNTVGRFVSYLYSPGQGVVKWFTFKTIQVLSPSKETIKAICDLVSEGVMVYLSMSHTTTPKELKTRIAYALSNTADRHYHAVKVSWGNSGVIGKAASFPRLIQTRIISATTKPLLWALNR